MSGSAAGRVFISYRRQQSSDIAGRLYDPAADREGFYEVRLSVPRVTGRAVFEWVLGGQFLVERSEVPGAPDGIAIVGLDRDGQAYTQHYFDSRGVARVYAMTFRDGVWTLLRDAPDFAPLDFWQRFTAEFSADGRTISGRWETFRDGLTWEHDSDLTYRKVT